MKKYFVFVISLTISFSAFAQKKEIKTATKEMAKGNYEKAVLNFTQQDHGTAYEIAG